MQYSRKVGGMQQVLKPPELPDDFSTAQTRCRRAAVRGWRARRPVARPHQQPQRRRCSRAAHACAAAAAARGGHCAAGRADARTIWQGASDAQAIINLCFHSGEDQREGPLQQAPLQPLHEAAVREPLQGGQ
jgi:hypothetical protein